MKIDAIEAQRAALGRPGGPVTPMTEQQAAVRRNLPPRRSVLLAPFRTLGKAFSRKASHS